MSLPSPWSGPLGFESVLVGFRAAFVEGRVLLKPLLEQTQGRKWGGAPVGQLLAYTTSWWHLDGMTMVQSLGVTVRARDRKTVAFVS